MHVTAWPWVTRQQAFWENSYIHENDSAKHSVQGAGREKPVLLRIAGKSFRLALALGSAFRVE